MMQLPAGLVEEGCRIRSFKLVNADGMTDMKLHGLMESVDNHPMWVSKALLLILQELAGEKPSLERVQRLCLADRQAIILAWRLRNKKPTEWLTHSCIECEKPFDISVALDQLSFSDVGESYPSIQVKLSCGYATVRVPDGTDLVAISNMRTSQEELNRTCLAARLITKIIPIESAEANDSKQTGTLPSELSEADIDAVEQAVDAMVPELVTNFVCECPECGVENTLSFDPYACLSNGIEPLLDEVHRIAQVYHWSEQDILALPGYRRQQYLQRIGSDNSFSGGML